MGFSKIPIPDSNIVKAAFITTSLLFVFQWTSFGLSGAPNTFQEAMESDLALVMNDFVHVYLDNIIITSSTFVDHPNHLSQVYGLLQPASFILNEKM